MKLDERQKAWLVTAWATYKRGPDILREFTDTFGGVITKQQAHHYDCTGVRDDEQAKTKGVLKWLTLFREARKRFDDSVVDIPIANKAWRIRQLDTMFDIAFTKKNYKSAAQLLEQAAKETGGAFSNVRKVDGAIDHKHDHEHHLPEEVRDASLAERLRAAMATALAEAHATTPQQTIQ